jgi:hypothetical protein
MSKKGKAWRHWRLTKALDKDAKDKEKELSIGANLDNILPNRSKSSLPEHELNRLKGQKWDLVKALVMLGYEEEKLVGLTVNELQRKLDAERE